MDSLLAFKSLKCVDDHVVLESESSRIKMMNHHNKAEVKLLSAPSNHIEGLNQGKKQSVLSTMNKIAKGKLSLGAKILQVGGVEKLFKRIFEVNEGEQLLKTCQCSLFTTAGPLAGRLFVTSEKVAFCSDKAIAKLSSPSGQILRYHYKVVIPLKKIKKAKKHENANKPSKKYLQVVTDDDFEFWFVGFPNYKKAFRSLMQALSIL